MRRILSKTFYNRFKRHLRRLSMGSPAYGELKLLGRFKRPIGTFKNGKTKWVFMHRCNLCALEIREYEVDHINEVAHQVREVDKYNVELDLGLLVEEMFPRVEQLQKLCGECHGRKTQAFLSGRRTGSEFL